MPASFARDLCGYRAHGKPNTSDASDALSVELGRALFDALGVDASAKGDEPTGGPFSGRVAADLRERVAAAGKTVLVVPERPLNAFEQFRHVGALSAIGSEPSRQYQRAWNSLARHLRGRGTVPPGAARRMSTLIREVEEAVTADSERRQRILDQVGQESLLKLDVTVGRARGGSEEPSLLVGLSLKWSLRTDRAQDCRSQGAKMAALRRGTMPHFAAVTMEPRPYMLNLLGGGSGDVDCVYHLDLAALVDAVHTTCEGNPKRRATLETFQRLVTQRRVRDYDELVDHTLAL